MWIFCLFMFIKYWTKYNSCQVCEVLQNLCCKFWFHPNYWFFGGKFFIFFGLRGMVTAWWLGPGESIVLPSIECISIKGWYTTTFSKLCFIISIAQSVECWTLQLVTLLQGHRFESQRGWLLLFYFLLTTLILYKY